MRQYTREAIRDKFGRMLGEDRVNKDKEILKNAGITSDQQILRAFLIGRLDTLVFDMVASLEAKTCSPQDRQEMVTELLPKINSILGRHDQV